MDMQIADANDPSIDETDMTEAEFDREFAAGTPTTVYATRDEQLIATVVRVVGVTSNIATGPGSPVVIPVTATPPLIRVANPNSELAAAR
jgi:hypothetical protein